MHTSLPDSIDKALQAANFSNRNYIIIRQKNIRVLHHSYRRATIGSNRAALSAG